MWEASEAGAKQQKSSDRQSVHAATLACIQMFTDIDTCLLPSCRVAKEREQEVPALTEDVASLKEGREKEASALREEVASLKEKVALYLGHS